ncbi:MAG: hypothetical protein JSS30_03350 [Verrucomicrobia bacterium]|nr:hypothetical protein [Verrucomicrobiota bacterium]
MKKILLLLLTTLLTAATPIERNLQSIDYRTQAGATIVLITLTDGSIWKWTPDHFSENLLRKWTEGDPIIIQAVNHPGFLLQNLSKPLYTPTVALSFNSYPLYPSIKDYDSTQDIITLSDDSQWVLLFDFNKRTLHHWAKDDRVIPVKGANNNYELINLDVPFDNRSQIERFVVVLPYIQK